MNSEKEQQEPYKNTKKYRSHLIRSEIESLIAGNHIYRSRKTESAVTLFIQYCVNHTGMNHLSEISSQTMRDYIQHHIARSDKSREYDSFKRLKDDVMMLEQLILENRGFEQKVNFSLLNIGLWSSQDMRAHYNKEAFKSKRNFFLQ
ncbi:hypothetical protein CEF21_21060 [Bacillus sp. FJAT-42376]|uniref:hypothetical protein n=1 Tax=Bacillus sp. FJAT-42376 TaxID=2014076 RepID=UPI000F4D6563|nr:hypothetical protein [Bacillus sp. FJAT-42376]AZB44573.1 hypothetical protein CEF21_21060 [Bacillus sp. FJAT-42376]